MEEFHPHSDEMIFNAEEAHNIVKECIEGILGKVDYNHNKVNQWTATIVEQSLTHLVKLGKTYKYIVTCAVMQKCGAGLHTASSCFWDTTTDGKFPHSDSSKIKDGECATCCSAVLQIIFLAV
ncbi:hypothetical protein KIL84_019182 [Mauremys mutica]|uniref:Dynein light chain Tctex-type 3 n=1 Tax=Mauremys mutica TaxID=74926 RepID=A0A9D4B9S6_9SAUR|nr:hypothetical protein KIL84_019182 [Mauremys mutica]